jgi:putative transposase
MHHPQEDPKPVTPSLSSLPEDARSRALARFQTIRPFLEEGVPLTQIAREQGVVLRTARRWVDRYRREGLTGLARKERDDKDKRKLTPALQQVIEGLALRKPRLAVAAIHRKVAETARKLGQEPPSYKVVHAVIGKLELALVTLAHQGSKAYSESFDLIHRTEADAPNAIWQADHTELDILVKDGDGKARRP